MNASTIIRTSEGKTKAFAGIAARFIVSHPRLSAVLAFAAGALLGHLLA